MRVWGEDARLLAEAGADVAALAALEAGVATATDLPAGPRWDAHVHLGRDADGHRLDADALVADMDAWGVARSVCFPPDEPGDDGAFTAANRRVTEAAAARPDRIVAFCRVDPARDAERAMDDAARDGARGLKLHPVAQRFPVDSPRAVACVRRATSLGWPVLIHAGFGARALAGPVAALLRQVPDARLILAHGARGDLRAVRDAVAGHPGVWFDTSLATLPDLAALPPERLVFGTDRPYGEHATALQLVALAASAAGWDRGAVEGVLWRTLAAILGER